MKSHLAFLIAKTSEEEGMFCARTHDLDMTTKAKVIHVQRSSFDSVHNSCNEKRFVF